MIIFVAFVILNKLCQMKQIVKPSLQCRLKLQQRPVELNKLLGLAVQSELGKLKSSSPKMFLILKYAFRPLVFC
jgi:hypothetical protein